MLWKMFQKFLTNFREMLHIIIIWYNFFLSRLLLSVHLFQNVCVCSDTILFSFYVGTFTFHMVKIMHDYLFFFLLSLHLCELHKSLVAQVIRKWQSDSTRGHKNHCVVNEYDWNHLHFVWTSWHFVIRHNSNLTSICSPNGSCTTNFVLLWLLLLLLFLEHNLSSPIARFFPNWKHTNLTLFNWFIHVHTLLRALTNRFISFTLDSVGKISFSSMGVAYNNEILGWSYQHHYTYYSVGCEHFGY